MKRRKATFTRVIGQLAIGVVFGTSLLSGCDMLKTGNNTAPAPAVEPAIDDSGTDSSTVNENTGTGGQSQRVGSTCCTAHEKAGCSDKEAEKCVCVDNELSECCTNAWDVVCVEMAKALGCGICPNDCCSITNLPGCEDNKKVQECVCTLDKNCCSKWDDFCVQLNTAKCGICSN